jgi:penicillin amidase
MAKKIGKLGVALVLVLGVSVVLSIPIDIIPPLGGLIDPFSGIWTIYQDADHPAYSTVSAPGHLSAPVTVIRDSWGVPHIYADHEPDLFFAFGYVQAQDRLWQMDITRRTARGQLAEILGPDYLSTDIYLRTIGLEHAAQTTLDIFLSATDPYNLTLQTKLLAFTAGVNFYMSQIGSNLPLEFKLLNYHPQPWSLVDSFAIGRILDFSLSWDDIDLRFAKMVDYFGNASTWELFPLNPPLQIPVVPEYGETYVPPPTPSDINFKELPESLHHSIDSVL